MMKRHGRAAADQSYGGVFVYNRPEQVLEQYDLEVRAVSKGRESYICDTTQGQLLLKEYKGSAERAEFLSAILGWTGTLNGAGRADEGGRPDCRRGG